MQLRQRLIQIAREIIPSDHYEITGIRKTAKDTYTITAQDREYYYSIEVSLTPHGEDRHYRLLDFSYTPRGTELGKNFTNQTKLGKNFTNQRKKP